MTIVSRISLPPGAARIEMQTEVENSAADHRLRVHFPAPIRVDHADYDGHFEVVRRPLGVPEKGEDWVEDPRPEVPQLAFTDASDGKIGLMLANRGLPEVEVIAAKNGSPTEIALTLLRCVGWLSRDDMSVRQGHAGPALETPGAQMPGKWVFEYAVIPHAGDWRSACQQAYGFQTALRGMETHLHAGEFSPSSSFFSHTPAEFVISAVKPAETGEGWLMRGYNLTPETSQLTFKPHRRFENAALVNLAEEPFGILEVQADGSVSAPVTGYQIVSILFRD